MSELIPHAGAQPVTFLPRQDEYRAVVDLATRLSSTEFVPAGFRGKPESTLAAMLVGRELGIGPMHALRSIHVIEGKPTLSAELMMALVLKAGHDLYVAESSRERCEVRYRRREWPQDRPDGVVVWTDEDAQDAGLANKGTWQKYRRAMLRSRAVSEACRQGFPDVTDGVSYTAEELGETDDAVVVEHVTTERERDLDTLPEPDPESEVEQRRALYERARTAFARIKTGKAEAWRAAIAGLSGSDAARIFQTGDLMVLEERVEQLERQADEQDGGDGGEVPASGPEGDGGDDDAGDEPAAGTDDPEQPSDPTAGTCRECREIVHDPDCPLVGDGRPVCEPDNHAEEDDGPAPHSPRSATDEIRKAVHDASVDDVKAAVERGDYTAAQALAAESSGKRRATLLPWLRDRVWSDDTAPVEPEPAEEAKADGLVGTLSEIIDGHREPDEAERADLYQRFRVALRIVDQKQPSIAVRLQARAKAMGLANDGGHLAADPKRFAALVQDVERVAREVAA